MSASSEIKNWNKENGREERWEEYKLNSGKEKTLKNSKKELQIKMKGVRYTTHSDGNVEDDSVEASSLVVSLLLSLKFKFSF